MENKSFGKFLIVWVGQLISSIGSGLTGFALGVYAYQQTHTATSFALITLCSFLPSILLRPIGGVLADRFDRRLMMMIGDLGSAAGLIFVFIMLLAGNTGLWQIYLGVTVSSVFVALQSPAYKASVTDLLDEDQFSKASGLVQMAESSKFLFSPIIAGLLLTVTDIKTILIIDILTFIIAIMAVFVIQKNLKKEKLSGGNQHFMLDLKDGWDAISSNKGVLLIVIIISIATFYIGFLQTLLGPMVLAFSNEKTLGIMQSGAAVGSLVGSILISIFKIKGKYSRMLFAGLLSTGIFFALTGLAANIYFICASGFMFLFSLAFVNTSADVLVRKNIENEKQGRAWGIIGVLSQLGFVIAYCISGFIADYIFNPLLVKGGLLAPTVGKIIGTGNGRGIGFLFIISGVFVAVLAVITSRIKSISALEKNPTEC